MIISFDWSTVLDPTDATLTYKQYCQAFVDHANGVENTDKWYVETATVSDVEKCCIAYNLGNNHFFSVMFNTSSNGSTPDLWQNSNTLLSDVNANTYLGIINKTTKETTCRSNYYSATYVNGSDGRSSFSGITGGIKVSTSSANGYIIIQHNYVNNLETFGGMLTVNTYLSSRMGIAFACTNGCLHDNKGDAYILFDLYSGNNIEVYTEIEGTEYKRTFSKSNNVSNANPNSIQLIPLYDGFRVYENLYWYTNSWTLLDSYVNIPTSNSEWRPPTSKDFNENILVIGNNKYSCQYRFLGANSFHLIVKMPPDNPNA